MEFLEYAVVGFIVLAMIVAGWILPTGYPLSWPMYAWMTAAIVVFRVVDEGEDASTSYELNPYGYLPRGEFLFDPITLDLLATFVARDKKTTIEPIGELVGPFGRLTVGHDNI